MVLIQSDDDLERRILRAVALEMSGRGKPAADDITRAVMRVLGEPLESRVAALEFKIEDLRGDLASINDRLDGWES